MGRIPGTDFFAGRVQPAALPAGELWRCLDCESLFRHPALAQAVYNELYETGTADQWSSDSNKRLDLQTVRSVVLSRAGDLRVLDVGCGSGDFLASLPQGISRFGIEPSTGAAALAERRGIRIAAAMLEQLPEEARFDVITIIDVIEHLPEPKDLLERAYAHLSPGGLIIVSTGDPLTPAWRKFFGARFWYSSFPEHITFPSRAFFAAWAKGKGAAVTAELATRYMPLSAVHRAIYLLIQVVYWISPRLLDWTGRLIGTLQGAPHPRRQHFSPGVKGLFVDHQVIAIRRA
jgi:SAM-dependent methyltransferase